MKIKKQYESTDYFVGITMEIEEILTKNIQVELSRIRMLLFVIAFVLVLEFLL